MLVVTHFLKREINKLLTFYVSSSFLKVHRKAKQVDKIPVYRELRMPAQ